MTNSPETSEARLRAKLQAAHAALAALDPRQALRDVTDALRLARGAKDSRALSEALSIATLAHYYRGDYVGAVATGIDACAAADRADHVATSMALYGVALSFVATHDFKRAAGAANRAIVAAAMGKDLVREGAAFSTLGVALAEGGNLDEALRAFRRACLRLRAAEDTQKVKRTLCNVGTVMMRQGNRCADRGDMVAAQRHWRGALRYFRLSLASGASRLDDINTRVAHAECLMRLGRLDAAASALRVAAARCRENDLPVVTGYLSFVRGQTALRQGRLAHAQRHLRRGIELLDIARYDENPADCRDAMAEVSNRLGHADDALRWREEARNLRASRRAEIAALRRDMQPLWDRYLRRVC